MAVRFTSAARGATGLRGRVIQSYVTDYKAFVGRTNREVRSIMLGAAKIVLRNTLPLVPVDTGALRESGRAKVLKTNKGYAGIVSFGGEDAPVTPTRNAPEGIVDYATYVNYAKRDLVTGEHMFLEKGSQASKDEVNVYIVNRLRKIT